MSAAGRKVTLDDIKHEWTVVARRVRITDKREGWEYAMPPRQVTVLHIAEAHGSVEIEDRPGFDGRLVKVARRSGEPAREGERFAAAGIGLFDR